MGLNSAMTMNGFTVGVFQPPYPDPDAARTSATVVESLFDDLARSGRGCDLIVLPEYANCPGIDQAGELHALAASAGEGFLKRAVALATALSANVAVNVLLERDRRYYNTTVLIDRRGQPLAQYDKTHLTRSEREDFGITAGEAPVSCILEGIRIGFLTCVEIYLAEYVERVAADRPDVVIFPTYQRSEEGAILRRQAQGRALDLEAFLLRSSYAMGKASPTGGGSMVVNPRGEILVDAHQQPGLFTCRIDPREKRPRPAAHGRARQNSRDIIEDLRRPDLYRSNRSDH